jgi:hypothetical protein
MANRSGDCGWAVPVSQLNPKPDSRWRLLGAME